MNRLNSAILTPPTTTPVAVISAIKKPSEPNYILIGCTVAIIITAVAAFSKSENA